MNHFNLESWMNYAQGSDIDRMVMEDHLSACADCQVLYLEAVEHLGDLLPPLKDASAFALAAVNASSLPADAHRSAVPEPTPADKRKGSGFLSKPIYQYLVAASITLILAGSGAFQQLFELTSTVSRDREAGQRPALAEQWTEKAGAWLDQLPVKPGWKEEMNDE